MLFLNVGGEQKLKVRGSGKKNKLDFLWASPVFLELVCQVEMVKEGPSHHHFTASEGKLISTTLGIWVSNLLPLPAVC